jgi:hypothetical protein
MAQAAQASLERLSRRSSEECRNMGLITVSVAAFQEYVICDGEALL